MKQKRDAQETKEKIIQAARDIFAKKGYSGTSVDDIARVVGITKGGIYWHFDSKLDLFIQMLESGYSEFMNLLNEIIAQDSAPLAKLRQLFTTTLMAIEEDKNF
ncbi:MAG: TetR family transcriptional regulator, partial [Candidatus Hydrogenedentes bacterium]|nr:TetR family transcriptional regulator [Candidatus Hydrogenedentota bacterium]